MIAFGCSVSDPEPYRRYVQPGVRLAAEPDSEELTFAAVGTIGRCYNLLIDAAATRDDLEALVIVHPHTEISDPELCQKVRKALSDPEVGVVGAVGASDVRTIAWWEGSVSRGSAVHRYTEYGGGELPAYSWKPAEPAPREVDVVDGNLLLALSPWVVHNLRFDEGLALGHGFDLDFCFQVRAAGRKVVTADLHVVEHRPLEVIGDLELWTEAHVQLAQKWEGRIPGADATGEASWKVRARRAEAEREAARSITYSDGLAMDARINALEQAIEVATESRSWRLTRPLREVNRWRRERSGGVKHNGGPEHPPSD